jgi:hypothetical protein
VRALVIAALLLHGTNALAYECTNVPGSNPRLTQAWNQRCLPYYLGNAGTLLDGEERRQLVLQSFRVWSTPPCTDLTFVDFGYTDQDPGFNPQRKDNQNIVVSIEDEGTASQLFTRGELAITITSFNTATGEIFDADIMINANDFAFDDHADRQSCEDRPLKSYDLRNTLVHEIGHFIGFEHDNDENSTMFASAPECEVKKRDLTQDNIQGVCNVYGTNQQTMTCAGPDTYDKGPGNPEDFRNQCDRAELSGCSCISTPDRPSIWALLFVVLIWRRRTARPRAVKRSNGR